MEILSSAPVVQNRNKNFSLLAIVLNWAPCKYGQATEGSICGMVRRKVGRAGVKLLLRREVFPHSLSLLQDSSLICALRHKQLCWLTWHSFSFHCKYLPCLLSRRGSGSPCLVSFSWRLHMPAALGLLPLCSQEGMGTSPHPCLHLSGTWWVWDICMFAREQRWVCMGKEQGDVTDAHLPRKYWAFATHLRENHRI